MLKTEHEHDKRTTYGKNKKKRIAQITYTPMKLPIKILLKWHSTSALRNFGARAFRFFIRRDVQFAAIVREQTQIIRIDSNKIWRCMKQKKQNRTEEKLITESNEHVYIYAELFIDWNSFHCITIFKIQSRPMSVRLVGRWTDRQTTYI